MLKETFFFLLLLASTSTAAFAENNAHQHYQKGLQLYLNGSNQDHVSAHRFFSDAADLGHGLAQYHLGLLNYRGHGVDRNYSQAHHWFNLAAEQNVSGAHHYLGTLHRHGHGVNANPNRAIYWYSRSLRYGYYDSIDPLAQLYLSNARSTGTLSDLLVENAKAGDISSQYNLASSYYIGNKVKQDHTAALGWFLKAASQGDSGAQAMLAKMYHLGQGAEKSNYQCAFWALASAHTQHDAAATSIDEELTKETQALKELCAQALSNTEYEKAVEQAHAFSDSYQPSE